MGLREKPQGNKNHRLLKNTPEGRLDSFRHTVPHHAASSVSLQLRILHQKYFQDRDGCVCQICLVRQVKRNYLEGEKNLRGFSNQGTVKKENLVTLISFLLFQHKNMMTCKTTETPFLALIWTHEDLVNLHCSNMLLKWFFQHPL